MIKTFQNYGLKLFPWQTKVVPDLLSPSKDANGKQYCFSDGVGVMSIELAKQIKQKLQDDCILITIF